MPFSEVRRAARWCWGCGESGTMEGRTLVWARAASSMTRRGGAMLVQYLISAARQTVMGSSSSVPRGSLGAASEHYPLFHVLICRLKNRPKNVCLEIACFLRPLMLYYEHCRLNGLCIPIGFETFLKEHQWKKKRRLNGLCIPIGFETTGLLLCRSLFRKAKWSVHPNWV